MFTFQLWFNALYCRCKGTKKTEMFFTTKTLKTLFKHRRIECLIFMKQVSKINHSIPLFSTEK